MSFSGRGVPLTKEGVKKARKIVDIDVPRFWAVMSVESGGFGFLRDRRPKILFERHIFHKRTNGKYSAKHPDISNPQWGGHGKGGANQYARLQKAMSLDKSAALESASWGVGQVMGFNAKSVGFSSAQKMVDAMRDSEDAQMLAMFNFIKKNKLGGYLRNGQWAEFAKRYNGPGYKKNKYDKKLEQAHNRYQHRPPPDLTVRAAQTCLEYLGFNPKGIDGIFGDNSQAALIRYQKSRRLEPDGKLDDPILERLMKEAF